MKRNIARTRLVIIFVAALVVSMAVTAQAGAAACSLAGAAGTYGFTDSGTVVGVGPRTAVGVFTLDAAGNLLNGKATSSLNGSIADETFSGTYTVNPDCTGTFSVAIFVSGVEALALTGNLAFDDNVGHMRAIFTSAVLEPSGTPLATVIALDAKKLFPDQSNQ